MTRILYLGTAGSDDPTRAGLPFNFAMGALDAGRQGGVGVGQMKPREDA
jgi:hypothetical protein